ncbi:MAG: phage tail length tape measure family protein [Afipia sp.]
MANDLEQLVLTISADTRQMQRALQRLTGDTKAAADSVDAAFSRATPKIDNVAKSLNKTRFETANLAAQFQDVAVQLQGGQSPFTIALQQGTQISQVIGQRGAAGAVGLLGAAFGSLLNPVSIATIAIIALGGSAVQYITKALGGVDDLDEKLKQHGELIKSLKDAYGEAGRGVDTAVHESIAVLQTFTKISTESMKRDFANLAMSTAASFSEVVAVTDSVGGSTVIERTAEKYKAFKAAIDDFRESVRTGNPDMLALRRGIAEIAETTSDVKVRKLAAELREATASMASFQLKIEEGDKAIRNFDPAVIAATESAERFEKAMKVLESTVSPKLDDRQRIIENYNKALLKAGGTEGRLRAARAKDAQLGILADNERKEAAEKAGKEAESAVKRFDSALASVAKQTAQVRAGTPALAVGAGAMVRMLQESAA